MEKTKEKGMAVYNIKSVTDFVGPILAKEALFDENPELLKEFMQKVEGLGDTISDELNLAGHMAKYRTFPLYMALKPMAEVQFEQLKLWARTNGLFK